MEKLIKMVETMKPFFEKVSNNPYLRAIRDGFVSCIPVILFSSLFILVACVPEIFGYKWPDNISSVLWLAYNASMGILSLLMVATIAKSLTGSINHKLPKLRQINDTSVMIVSIICLVLLAVEPIKGGWSADFMGSKGLLSAFVVAFSVPNIYKFFVSRDITIKLPDEVPHFIAQTFADLIPLSVAVFIFWLVSIVFKNVTGILFSAWILELFKPLFVAADGYIGIAIIYGAMAMFWFVGIHGPSIVEPAVTAIYIANIEANLQIATAGGHATNILTHPTSYFVATLGGTGATLMFCAMCAFIAKSKQLKAVGRASIIPVCFAVNEPILFGAPIVLNPVLFVPFIAAPIANVWIFKFFVDNLGMNSFLYILPWTTPAPIGLVIATGFATSLWMLFSTIRSSASMTRSSSPVRRPSRMAKSPRTMKMLRFRPMPMPLRKKPRLASRKRRRKKLLLLPLIPLPPAMARMAKSASSSSAPRARRAPCSRKPSRRVPRSVMRRSNPSRWPMASTRTSSRTTTSSSSRRRWPRCMTSSSTTATRRASRAPRRAAVSTSA